MFLNKKNLKNILAPQALILSVAIGFYCMLKFKSEPPQQFTPIKIQETVEVKQGIESVVASEDLKTESTRFALREARHDSVFKSPKKSIRSIPRLIPPPPPTIPEYVEENYDSLEAEEIVAVNLIQDPILDDLADQKLSEEFPSLAENFISFDPEIVVIEEPTVKRVVSLLKQNNYSEIEESYLQLKKDAAILSDNLGSAPRLAKREADTTQIITEKSSIDIQPQLASPQIPTQVITKIADSIQQRLQAREELGLNDNRVEVDPTVNSWLEKKQGHIEIHAQNPNNKNDFHVLEYSKEDSQFELPKNTQSSYNLVARVFVPNKTTPIAEIKHLEPITPHHNDEKGVVFNVSAQDFHKALKLKKTEVPLVPLVVTVFKGLVGNRDAPEPISDAEVQIVGIPNKFKTKENGILRLSNLPSMSEYILTVQKPGYYPTKKIIATSQETTYQSIYLLPKPTVDIVTNDFLKDPQLENRSILFGRVLNSQNRLPLKGEKVVMPFENVKTVYFDAFPTNESASTTEGLFSIFNAPSSAFKTLTRSRAIPSQIFDLKPGEAQYVELGSNKPQRLFGKIIDAYGAPIAKARIRLVGENQNISYSDEKGNFYIDEIDYPKGILSLEIEAQGFFHSLHTFGWHPEGNQRRYSFYLRELEKVEDSVQLARLGKSVLKKATILGGVDKIPKEMIEKNQCLLIELTDSMGRKISKDHGPFLLQDNPNVENEPCVHTKNPGFGFYNLEDGLYHLKINQKHHVVFASAQKAAMIVSPY